ncbi:hypothetical protein Y032_0310g2122 [Ancylostoma ceylanicum]|uniref:NTR domain-containing protein n=1 Tax=Ancylostoma ceylanicum TaxID=53326 RepID=A0A016S2R5_9BILA|nr:hypothetical protein Y032_0310g2122 [Ancylostoma ceylanicum]
MQRLNDGNNNPSIPLVNFEPFQVQRGAVDPTEPMLFLLVFIACFTSVHAACSCEPFKTVKEAFCKSDYVLLAKVLSINSKYGEVPTKAANDTNKTNDGTWFYDIWHMRTWKGPIVATSLLTTANSGEGCGVTGLLKDWEYFLTGKKGEKGEITFTSCDFVMPHYDLTAEELELLMDLRDDPKKCDEKDDEKNVKENENSVDGSGEKTVEENGEKTVEENGEQSVEERDEKTVEHNGEKTVEGKGGQSVGGNDDEPPQEDDEKTVKDNAEQNVEKDDDQPPQEDDEKTVDDEDKDSGDQAEEDSDDQAED